MIDPFHARLLLAVLRRSWTEAETLVARRPVDPDRFVQVVRDADVHGWVHELLSREKRWDLVGSAAEAQLAQARNKVRNDNILLLARTEQALDLLLGAGIVPVALKGLDTLHRFYNSFDERTLDDVDLLVRQEQLRPALEALQSGGWLLPPEPQRTHYIRSSHHLPLRSPGPIPVEFELHWSLAQEMRYRIDDAGLFERALPANVAGREVLRLADTDLVAHLLIHHFSHYFDCRLKWLVDLHALAHQPGFEWAAVAERARSWEATAASGISLVHLHKLWPELISADVLDRLPVAAWRLALTWPLRSSHPLELFRHTRNRHVQLYLAAVMLDRPASLPAWLLHRMRRDRRPGINPLDRAPGDSGETNDSSSAGPSRGIAS